MVKQSPLSIGSKGNQEVQIAIRGKVIAQSRTKQRQLADFPTMAELGDFILGDCFSEIFHFYNILDFCEMLYKIGFIISINEIESIQIAEQMTNKLLE